ncbi:MAG: RluA family pseudouridine synthase [Treponema sp.]|jgi:23S rRNA pseudouridine1911/1915/1917 synthase|nr:RluA family pseudouridine synthase [Treponema sp.]
MPSFSCVAEDISPEMRLDRFVAEKLKLLTRSQVKTRRLIARINGKPVKISRIVQNGDCLELSWDEAAPSGLTPEDIPLETLYEDNRVIVINKQQGIVVHPGAGNARGTVANALLYRRLSSGGVQAGAAFRPGIVHRLDKDTSGVLIAAYDDDALTFLADQFKNRKTRKLYAAVVQGIPKAASGVIEGNIARDSHNRKRFSVSGDKGKAARTYYKIIRSWEKTPNTGSGGYGKPCALLLLCPKTGRTHQLRVHLRHIGHPILGDPIYGAPDPHISLMLHAKSLSIVLPGKTEMRTFKTPLPERFLKMLRV